MSQGLERIDGYPTLNGIAYDKIVNALRTGRFEPGESLTTRTLADQLGISSTPVREALSKLIAQNALEVTPSSRAAVVPQLTQELLAEMYEIRHLLDAVAGRAAAQNITAAETARLATLAAELDSFEHEGETDSAEYLDKSEEFFLGVFAAARRPILYSVLENLWLRSNVILGLLHRRRPEDFTISAHRSDLVAALERCDPDAAEAAISAVLVSTRAMIFSLMNDDETAANRTSPQPPEPTRRKKTTG